MDAADTMHTITYMCVGLPTCALLFVLPFCHSVFWKRHQTIMMVMLLVIGLCIIVSTIIWVPQAGFGTVTMYIVTLYAFKLVHFINR